MVRNRFASVATVSWKVSAQSNGRNAQDDWDRLTYRNLWTSLSSSASAPGFYTRWRRRRSLCMAPPSLRRRIVPIRIFQLKSPQGYRLRAHGLIRTFRAWHVCRSWMMISQTEVPRLNEEMFIDLDALRRTSHALDARCLASTGRCQLAASIYTILS